MANPTENETFVGSHEKAFTSGSKSGRGQNGGNNPASIRGTVPNIPAASPPGIVTNGPAGKSDANSMRDSFNTNAASDDARLAQIHAGGEKPHSGHRSRIAGHEGGTVPNENMRGVAARKANPGQNKSKTPD